MGHRLLRGYVTISLGKPFCSALRQLLDWLSVGKSESESLFNQGFPLLCAYLRIITET